MQRVTKGLEDGDLRDHMRGGELLDPRTGLVDPTLGPRVIPLVLLCLVVEQADDEEGAEAKVRRADA